MILSNHVPQSWRQSVSFVALCLLLAGLFIAGGASRADVFGQVITRAVAFGVLIAAILVGPGKMRGGGRVPSLILIGALALVIAQLVPLPPAIWQSFPGRSLLAQAGNLDGQHQPWRPWSMVPGATFNSAASLVVPIAVLFLLTGLTDKERDRLPGMILAVICFHSLVGLLQVSGAGFNNPLVNDTMGQVSGMFANRNHFALLLAIGCMLAPVWGFMEPRQSLWRVPLAITLTSLFVLMILASGSRAGLGLAALALMLTGVLTWSQTRRLLRQFPRWTLPAAIGGVVILLGVPVLLSVTAGRAVSIARLFELDPGQDMRQRALPTVLGMISDYFPWGTGMGTFDPIFRIHEPNALLKPSYFNHAHNDFLEIILNAGVAGGLLLVASIGWWMWASVAVWRGGSEQRFVFARLGSGILLLVCLASVFDYPARTPMMMALIMIAAIWLAEGMDQSAALPRRALHL